MRIYGGELARFWGMYWRPIWDLCRFLLCLFSNSFVTTIKMMSSISSLPKSSEGSKSSKNISKVNEHIYTICNSHVKNKRKMQESTTSGARVPRNHDLTSFFLKNQSLVSNSMTKKHRSLSWRVLSEFPTIVRLTWLVNGPKPIRYLVWADRPRAHSLYKPTIPLSWPTSVDSSGDEVEQRGDTISERTVGVGKGGYGDEFLCDDSGYSGISNPPVTKQLPAKAMDMSKTYL